MPRIHPDQPLGMRITGSKPLYKIGRDYEVQVNQSVWTDKDTDPSFDEVAASKVAIDQAVMLVLLNPDEYKNEHIRNEERTRWVATRKSRINETSFGEYEAIYLVRRTL